VLGIAYRFNRLVVTTMPVLALGGGIYSNSWR